MNRRNFLSTLGLGVVALPIIALAKTPATDSKRACKHIAEIPKEAGKVNCMAAFNGHVFVGCDNGLWTVKVEDSK